MRTRVTRAGAFCSLGLALAAGSGLLLWPCASRGAEGTAGGGAERQFRVSLIEADGMRVLGVLAVPVLLAGAGLVAVHRRWRAVLLAATAALVGFCVLGLASVGLFHLPAAAGLVVAVVGWRSAT